MSDKNLTALKTLVISMGVVLIVGFLVVMAGIWMKMKAGDAASLDGVKRSVSAGCPGGTVDLKGRGQIVDSSVEGQVMRFAITKGDELIMVHVDLCTGKEINTITIQSDMPGSGGPMSHNEPSMPEDMPPAARSTPVPQDDETSPFGDTITPDPIDPDPISR